MANCKKKNFEVGQYNVFTNFLGFKSHHNRYLCKLKMFYYDLMRIFKNIG